MKSISLKISLLIITLFVILFSCKTINTDADIFDLDPVIEEGIIAKIVSVKHTGDTGNYNFQVEVSSPDTGCEQYADWWEVITEEGELIYRRVLGHSHVNEQPFVRSGGGVTINADQIVIIRAHLNTTGYGTQVFKGSINNGFFTFKTADNFAFDLEDKEPQPSSCAF